MATAPATNGFRALKGVEIFCASGPDGHKEEGGREYTTADLDEMVRNFNLHSAPGSRKKGKPFLRVACTLGHQPGEPDVFADEVGAPAHGAITRVWRKGDSLYADMDGVPKATADMIDAGQYHATSAEVYDAPLRVFGGRGAMLRRCTFLGAEPPAVKTLAPLPRTVPGTPARFSERTRFDSRKPYRLSCTHTKRIAPGLYQCFSEKQIMNRDEMLEQLAQAGMDTSMVTDAVPDELLAEIIRLSEGQPEGQPGAEPAGAPGAAPVEEFSEPSDADDAKAKYTMHLGMAQKHGDYAEKCKKYAEEQGVMLGDGDGDEAAKAPGGQQVDITTQPPLKRKPGESFSAYSERRTNHAIAQAVKAAMAEAAQGQMAELRKFSEESLRSERVKAVDGIIDRLSLAGKLPPAEKGAARRTMLRLAGDPALHTFSEGGETRKATALDDYVSTIEQRPSLFREAIPASDHGSPKGDEAEVAKVEGHYESHAETFRKWGTPKAEFVGAFKTRRERDPAYTAAQYLGTK